MLLVMNVVLMAGGGGTRLWPLSRQHQPKQFLKLDNGPTLLERAYARARQLVDAQEIYVATTKEYQAQAQALLPQMPVEHILLEPERRDTGPAFAAVAAHLLAAGKGDEPAVFMWADHIFTAEQQYLKDARVIEKLVKEYPHSIVIMGHVPTYPETGFGYIEVGEKLPGYERVFRVQQFKEKPDAATAEQYVTSGRHFWNMGYVSLTPQHLVEQLTQHEPALAKGLQEYQAALARHDTAAAEAIYSTLPKISIDYALLERASDILVVTGDYGWSDVGNWAAVQDIFGAQGDHVEQGHHVHVDAANNYIYSTTDTAISLIGMQDTIVVVTEDAVLVTKKDRAHRVKEVVARLEEEGKTKYL